MIEIILIYLNSSAEWTGRIVSLSVGDGSQVGAVFPPREKPADPLRHFERCASAQLCRLHHERRKRQSGTHLRWSHSLSNWQDFASLFWTNKNTCLTCCLFVCFKFLNIRDDINNSFFRDWPTMTASSSVVSVSSRTSYLLSRISVQVRKLRHPNIVCHHLVR